MYKLSVIVANPLRRLMHSINVLCQDNDDLEIVMNSDNADYVIFLDESDIELTSDVYDMIEHLSDYPDVGGVIAEYTKCDDGEWYRENEDVSIEDVWFHRYIHHLGSIIWKKEVITSGGLGTLWSNYDKLEMCYGKSCVIMDNTTKGIVLRDYKQRIKEINLFADTVTSNNNKNYEWTDTTPEEIRIEMLKGALRLYNYSNGIDDTTQLPAPKGGVDVIRRKDHSFALFELVQKVIRKSLTHS